MPRTIGSVLIGLEQRIDAMNATVQALAVELSRIQQGLSRRPPRKPHIWMRQCTYLRRQFPDENLESLRKRVAKALVDGDDPVPDRIRYRRRENGEIWLRVGDADRHFGLETSNV